MDTIESLKEENSQLKTQIIGYKQTVALMKSQNELVLSVLSGKLGYSKIREFLNKEDAKH